ncbi:hypothetical protein [Desulfobotulus mexicanus]|uniref:DNA ligase n=1 Tax=Desulfobotulus mexicanus TaxID=2586642 RepID=A0A5S5MBV7_9BACT|nr:hypothetical protein [Desulfobotulus mexicanus]TYT73105.1 hypothetical protein FIM25_16865 [Desulfobotulus mexicanus]
MLRLKPDPLLSPLVLCLLFFLSLPLFSSAMDLDPMLPEVYSEEREIRGWWMSEKLDGIRGYWDGTSMFSRNGTPLFPPDFFTAGLPPFAIEGELWAGRQAFEKTASIVMPEPPHG